MYALCVSGAVNAQGFMWKFLCTIYKFSFMHSKANDMLMDIVASVFCWSVLSVMIYSSE